MWVLYTVPHQNVLASVFSYRFAGVGSRFFAAAGHVLVSPQVMCLCRRRSRTCVAAGHVLVSPQVTCLCCRRSRAWVAAGHVLVFCVAAGHVLVSPQVTCLCRRRSRACVAAAQRGAVQPADAGRGGGPLPHRTEGGQAHHGALRGNQLNHHHPR